MPDVNYHLQRLSNLRSHRSNFDNQWEEAAQRIIPAHVASFHGRGWTNALSPGQKNTTVMFDATAALAHQRFTSVIDSLATPQGQQWHRLAPAEDSLRKNRQVKLYMDELTRILFRHRYRPKANFVGQTQQVYGGYGAYGNGIMFTDSTKEGRGLRYKSLHLGECFFMENHQGIIDTMYRSFHLKPRQIMQQFGTKTPESVQKEIGDPNKANTTYEIVHCIYPREEFDNQRKDSLGMPYASVYIFVKEQKLLDEGGYVSFPAAVARYMQFTNETYGRGPAQLVLPSIKVLNEQKKTVLKQGHRVVEPVLLAHDDGIVGTFSLRNGAINAGGVNAQGRPLVHVLPTGNIAVGKDLMDDERNVINDAFLITLFQILVDNPQMTATEVLERTREKGMLIAPTAGRLQAEYLGPMIERELDVLAEQGVLPQPPGILMEAGGGFVVEYDSPMARMARAENAAGFMRSLDYAVEFFKATQDPSPLDWFNFDKAMPALQDINGSPTEWTATPEEVKAKRDARAEQAEQQQMVEAAPAMASVVKSMDGMGMNQK